jgi:hypothetical protein
MCECVSGSDEFLPTELAELALGQTLRATFEADSSHLACDLGRGDPDLYE